MTRTSDLALTRGAPVAPPRDDAEQAPVAHEFETVYADHAPFIWRTLRALGVAPAQIDDAVQDVFIVVHQKLGSFRGPAKVQTWLFEIARRIASQYRRAAGRTGRSEPIDAAREVAAGSGTFEEASRNEATALVIEVLGMLDDAKRELLVLIELEQVPIPEVAAILKIPVNTAYSRLRLARRAFSSALARRRAGGRR